LPFYGWFALGVLSLGLSVFFALTHSAFRQFSRARLETALRRRGRLAALAGLYRHHEELVQMARSLHVLSLVALTVLTELWATDRFGPTLLGWSVGAVAAAALGVVFAGIIPMAWAKYAAESVLVATLPVCQACRVGFAPAQRIVRLFDKLVQRLAGAQDPPARVSHIEEEILSVAGEGEREGILEEDQRDMIENVITFPKTDASQVMTPRTDIVSIDVGATADEGRALVARTNHSRIPVTRGNIDTVVGILYAKDLLERTLGADEQVLVKDVMRPPLFVPETKKLHELLREFQGDKVHMAIVLDEYGGTAGLVTIEDVVEEIVGEIVDEYEQAPPKPIRGAGDRAWEVEARVRIADLNSELGLTLPVGEDYETVGGFVLSRLGFIPKAGEVLQQDNLRLTVLDAEERRITRLRIDLAPPKKKDA
jgi:CBS domain containing-hemolysin-like protein